MLNLDWTQFQNYVLLALAVVTGTGVAAAGLMALVKTVLEHWAVVLPLKTTNLLAAGISGALALPTLLHQGAPWPLAVLAVIAALFSPKVVYDNATVAGKKKEAIKENCDVGR